MVKKLQSILITTKIAKNTQEAIRLKSTTNPLLLRLCGALFELIILVKHYALQPTSWIAKTSTPSIRGLIQNLAIKSKSNLKLKKVETAENFV